MIEVKEERQLSSKYNFPAKDVWRMPVPEASKITKDLAALVIGASMIATPLLMMYYLCPGDLSKPEFTRKCFRKPSQFFLPPLMIGALVGIALNETRNLCYRSVYRIQYALGRI